MTASLSPAVSGVPLREATRVAVARLEFSKGSSSWAACMLGELAGRKPLSVSLATEPSPGRVRTQTTVTTSHTTTMRYRKRTSNLPRCE